MRTLDRYILSNFLVTFLMAMAVLTFVMMVGLVFGSMKYIARGMDAMLVVRFLLQNLPGTLSYSVPVASLVSSLLVFSRLSSDSEISAMRTCGVPLVAIMRTPALLAVLLSLLCLHVNDNVTPDASYSRAQRRNDFKANDIMALLEPRTWIEVGAYSLFIARRDGETLQDLRVNEPLPNGKVREIRAATAYVATNGEGRAFLHMSDVTIDPWREDEPGMSHAEQWALPLSALSGKTDGAVAAGPGPKREPVRRSKDLPTWALARDVLVARVHPPVLPADRARIAALEADVAEARRIAENPAEAFEAERAAVEATNALLRAAFEASNALLRAAAATNAAATNAAAAAVLPGPPEALPLPSPEAAEAAAAHRLAHAENRLARARGALEPALKEETEISRAKVEIGTRTTLALACLCFVLVGVPLGIQNHRRQSSVGIGLSLAIAGAFYFFCITAESLSKHPEMHAHWILPVPVLACLALAAWLVRRQN